MDRIARLVLVALVALPTLVHASTVTINFSGDITSITDPGEQLSLNGFNTSTTTFSGQIQYDIPQDVTFSGSFGNGTRAYYSSVESYVTVDGFEFSVSVGLFIDDFPEGSDGDKILKSTVATPELSSCIGSYDECQLSIRLYDSTGSVFTDTALPDSVDLNDFDIRNVEIKATSSGELYAINGNITTLTVSVVPLPPAVWLFASGVIGLMGISRKKNAQSRGRDF